VTQTAAQTTMSYAEYVAAEVTSPVKHEWLRGEVFAMAGGTLEHARLSAGIIGELQASLRGRPCGVFSSDLRIKVQETGLSTYPDVSIVCGKPEALSDDPHAIVNPIVLVEVLSDSTEGYDRGEKCLRGRSRPSNFAHYRRIPSLREYVLVSQREHRIEVHRLNESGRWELYEAVAGESITLTSLGCQLSVDEVYRDPFAGS
jgi:Uma2 family endonuclease